MTTQNDVDLDDDIPEAGSYQHTDTDVEEPSSESSEEVEESSMVDVTEADP